MSTLELQGFAGPWHETHKDRRATGCEEGVVLKCSHSPTDRWKQDIEHMVAVCQLVAGDWINVFSYINPSGGF